MWMLQSCWLVIDELLLALNIERWRRRDFRVLTIDVLASSLCVSNRQTQGALAWGIVWATFWIFVTIWSVWLVLAASASVRVYTASCLRATLRMLLKFPLVQSCNSWYLFLSHLRLTEWTASVDEEPLLYAFGVIVMSDITWQWCYHIVFCEVYEADHAAVLRLEHIWPIFRRYQWVDHHLRCLTLHKLFSSIQVEDVGDVWTAEDTHCEEEEGDQSGEDAEDDEHFIVELQ